MCFKGHLLLYHNQPPVALIDDTASSGTNTLYFVVHHLRKIIISQLRSTIWKPFKVFLVLSLAEESSRSRKNLLPYALGENWREKAEPLSTECCALSRLSRQAVIWDSMTLHLHAFILHAWAQSAYRQSIGRIPSRARFADWGTSAHLFATRTKKKGSSCRSGVRVSHAHMQKSHLYSYKSAKNRGEQPRSTSLDPPYATRSDLEEE